MYKLTDRLKKTCYKKAFENLRIDFSFYYNTFSLYILSCDKKLKKITAHEIPNFVSKRADVYIDHVFFSLPVVGAFTFCPLCRMTRGISLLTRRGRLVVEVRSSRSLFLSLPIDTVHCIKKSIHQVEDTRDKIRARVIRLDLRLCYFCGNEVYRKAKNPPREWNREALGTENRVEAICSLLYISLFFSPLSVIQFVLPLLLVLPRLLDDEDGRVTFRNVSRLPDEITILFFYLSWRISPRIYSSQPGAKRIRSNRRYFRHFYAGKLTENYI